MRDGLGDGWIGKQYQGFLIVNIFNKIRRQFRGSVVQKAEFGIVSKLEKRLFKFLCGVFKRKKTLFKCKKFAGPKTLRQIFEQVVQISKCPRDRKFRLKLMNQKLENDSEVNLHYCLNWRPWSNGLKGKKISI